jgi:hypothetical protein
MSRLNWKHAAALAIAFSSTGCIIEQRSAPPPDTEVGFDALMNFGQACGSQLTSWQVTLVEFGETLTGNCAYQPIFRGLAPSTRYTFEIVGYSGPDTCWQGSCVVPTELGTLTFGDCSASIQHLCGF